MNHGFGPATTIYRAPSYARIPSKTFQGKRNILPGPSAVTFSHVIGAETQSPEVIGGIVGSVFGGIVGGYIGERVAHSIKGFPPIWTELEITLRSDGSKQGRLVHYSYFPSINYYEADDEGTTPGAPFTRKPLGPIAYYNAVPNLDHWNKNGWGTASLTGSPGPRDGNPWSINK